MSEHRGFIPQVTIEKIRNKANLVEIVGGYVELKKSGQSYKGLCPFHNEKTASFYVYAHKGFFCCFGCQKKGDVYTFLIEMEGKTFVEAAEYLAKQTGISIPRQKPSLKAQKEQSIRTQIHHANQIAARFFSQTLADDSQGVVAQQYLSERSILPDSVTQFQLGYAPDSWDGLCHWLKRHDIPDQIALQAGLIVQRDSRTGYYDRFRHRLVCPVILPAGEIAGFSARTLSTTKETAKYINSPESPAFHKSSLLFGLHVARHGIRRAKQVLVVEGNFDVIALHQHGFEETVAPMGTALSSTHIEQLRRLSSTIVLLYDGDQAGKAATEKSVRAFLSADVSVRVAMLPTGQDPDSFIIQNNKHALKTLLSQSQEGIEYLIHEIWQPKSNSTEQQTMLLADAVKILGTIPNQTKRDISLGKLAAAMNVTQAIVAKAVNTSSKVNRNIRNITDQAITTKKTLSQRDKSELAILALLSNYPELMEIAETINILGLLSNDRYRTIYEGMQQGQRELSEMTDLDPFMVEQVCSEAYTKLPNPEHALHEALDHLKKLNQRKELAKLQKQAEDAGRHGDIELQRSLIKEIINIRKQAR